MKMEAFIKGNCTTMCPEEEMRMPQNHRLLHRLEIVCGTENDPKADPEKTIKAFSRSAADVKMDIPHLLRPFEVLYKTVQYLLTQVVATREVSTLAVYNFVWDRLRAVRQDMTIQSLPPDQRALLLEPMVRFHTLYGYKLCELPTADYDPVLNKKHLLDCLRQLLVCFDNMEVPDCNITSVECLQKLLNDKLELNNKSMSCDRRLMESLYILCNLDDNHPSLRYLQLPKKYRRALSVMSHAYHSKQLTFPSGALTRCLRFNSEEEARGACSHYGFELRRGDVLFDKSCFKMDARVLQPKKMLSMKEILLGTWCEKQWCF